MINRRISFIKITARTKPLKVDRFARSVLALLIFLISVPAHSTELEERATIRKLSSSAYGAGDFAALERQYGQYSDFIHQRTSSGAFKANLFFDGIADSMRDATDVQFKQDIDRTEKWVNDHKNSPLAYILHARALGAYGGYFRGNGTADTVPPQAWAIYEEYNGKTAKFLTDNEAVASKSTLWHIWMISLARVSGWPAESAMRFFEEGIKKDPTDYSLYRAELEYMMPKWRGNAATVDKFIRYAVTKAPPEYGMELYARLYSAAGEDEFHRRLYSSSLIDWEKMKEGLQLWTQRFPTSWNKNIFAYHACIAGDKKTAKALLSEIGNSPELEIWQPRAQATYETCVRWASESEAEPKAPMQSSPKAPQGSANES